MGNARVAIIMGSKNDWDVMRPAEEALEKLGVACDVSDADAVEGAVARTREELGGLDVLINSAGILHFTHTHEETLDAWNRVLAVNLTGTFLACRAALPHFVEQGRGVIVNMSSTAALKAHAWAAASASAYWNSSKIRSLAARASPNTTTIG